MSETKNERNKNGWKKIGKAALGILLVVVAVIKRKSND